MSFAIPYKLCSITSNDNAPKLFLITDYQHTVIIPYTLLTTDILFNLFRFRKNITIILNLYEQKIITQHHCLYTTNYAIINTSHSLSSICITPPNVFLFTSFSTFSFGLIRSPPELSLCI